MHYEAPAIEDFGSIADHTFMPWPPNGKAIGLQERLEQGLVPGSLGDGLGSAPS